MSIMSILTPQFFRDVYLAGVKTALSSCGLGASGAWELKDEVILHHLLSGISYVATALDIDLRSSSKRQFEEKYDQMDWHKERWYLKTSRVRPVKRIYSLSIQRGRYSGSPVDGYEEVPVEWVQIASEEQGSIFVLPYSGGSIATTHLPWGSHMDTWFRWMPLFVKIVQATGFEFDLIGTVTIAAGATTGTISGTGADNLQDKLQVGMKLKLGDEIVTVMDTPTSTTFTFTPELADGYTGTAVVMDYDPMILDAVANQAMIPILEVIAARLFGPYTSKSVSIDAVSQSRSLAVSPQSSAYFSQQSRARERRDEVMAALATKYRPLNFFSF